MDAWSTIENPTEDQEYYMDRMTYEHSEWKQIVESNRSSDINSRGISMVEIIKERKISEFDALADAVLLLEYYEIYIEDWFYMFVITRNWRHAIKEETESGSQEIKRCKRTKKELNSLMLLPFLQATYWYRVKLNNLKQLIEAMDLLIVDQDEASNYLFAD